MLTVYCMLYIVMVYWYTLDIFLQTAFGLRIILKVVDIVSRIISKQL